jgi:diguanylate cyclase (GGDEF)-like protein
VFGYSVPDFAAVYGFVSGGFMASERQLSEVLREFARTMLTDFPIQAILDHLVARIVEIMPITAAGVTLISPGVEPRYIAASDDVALRFETLQGEVGEGPGLAAFESGEAVSVPDLSREDRFPAFTSRALRAGLASVFSFPLHHGDGVLGALDLYRNTPGELITESMTAAQTLADVATAYLINAQARADLHDMSERFRKTALHDALTGLPNRILLLERLEHAFHRSRRSGLTSAVFFVDLDGFKNVNDSFGHRIGDELLVAVAQRLSTILRPGDTLARVSGDEFVIVCEDLADPAQADAIVSRLDTALRPPLLVSGIETNVTASIGIAFTGRDSDTPDKVLHMADMAMYRAKRAGGARHLIHDLRNQQVADDHAALEHDMHGLLGRGELHLDYQPIVATIDGSVTGVEALLRWTRPGRGPVSPSVLVPLAERLGMIPAIGQWVLEQAMAEQHRWHRQYGVDDLAVSVNVSAHQLTSTGFTETVAGVLAADASNPDMLTLEMTESVFVRDGERALVVLNDLKAMGVKLALDDFGTGYSSLGYLLEFPVDIVKIDQLFVAGLGQNDACQSIVAAVVQLAHGLGMTAVAEGVETAQQRQQLTLLGCDSCQGFYFARPMPASTLDTLIQRCAHGTHPHLPTPDAA